MKKKLKSTLSLLLCMIMVFGAVAVGGEGIKLPSIKGLFGTELPALTSMFSLHAKATYENTYSNTGNQRVDIVEVAKTQIGNTNGLKYRSDGASWCAAFVVWCARQAGIGSSIIKNTGWATADDLGVTWRGRNSDRTVGINYTPQSGDLIIFDWSSNGYCYKSPASSYGDHVGIVEYVSNGYVHTIEGNSGSPGSVKRRTYSLSSSEIKGYGIPNYSGSAASETGLDTDFYAYIINTASWKHLTNDSDNVSVRTLTGDSNQVWYFSKQADGSYSIRSAYDEKALEADNFGSTPQTNVQTFNYSGNAAQLWYITGQSAEYIFRPKCSENCVMDVFGNSSEDGANVQLYTLHGGESQKFQIWKLDDYLMKPKVSTAKSSYPFYSSVSINWSKSLGAVGYWLTVYRGDEKIFSENLGNVLTYTFDNLIGGEYVAYVEAFTDSDNWKTVTGKTQFTIENIPSPTIVTNKNSYSENENIIISWNKIQGATGYWLHIWKDGVVQYNSSVGDTNQYTITNAKAGSYEVSVESYHEGDGWNNAMSNYKSFAVSHSYDSGKITTAATCKSTGVKTYTCTTCGATKTETVAKNPSNHVGGTAIKNAKAATCTEKGYTGDTYCLGCGVVIAKGTEIAVKDHSYDSGKITTAATCKATGVKTYTCTICNATKTETVAKNPSNHVGGTAVKNAKTATCTAKGYTGDTYCLGCGVVTAKGTETAVKAHIPEDWVVVTKPTADSDGKKVKKCMTCGETLEEAIIPKLTVSVKISIKSPSTTTVSYGFTLNLHANVTDLLEGARIVWSMDGSGFELIPSADGMTCGVKSVSKGSATITAKVVDKNGNAVKDANGNEITASQQLTSKAGFFQKLVAFFKKLFGSNMVIPSSLNKLIK